MLEVKQGLVEQELVGVWVADDSWWRRRIVGQMSWLMRESEKEERDRE